MPVYRGVGVGRSMSPYDNVKGGGASLRQDDGGASLRQDDGDVSQRQNGGGVSLRTGNDTVDTQPPSRREYNSYTQPENRHFVSASLSSVDSDESIILVAGGFKRAQQPPRPVSTVSTDSGEDVLVYTPRRGHTRGRGSTIKAAVRPNAGLGGGASLKVDDDIPSPMTSSGAASSAYATSIEGRNGEEKKEVQMTPSLTTKPEPKPAQGSSPRLQPLVNSGETTTGALSAFPRSSLQHPLSTHNQQVCLSLA
ncbi:hypothetical protein GGR57DRAFT_316889 [Xylariaceae sp. FL1272]|nr:hypothetical protein GGR57DRAFT_316889 [Xylariaceae sp. FL1272]